MSIARRRRLPWSGDSPRETVVFAGAVIAVLYAVLTPLHLLLLKDPARPVMASVAAASAVLAAVLAVAAHRGRLPPHRLPLALATIATLPLVNALTHTAVASQIEQTAVTMLSIVAIAAVAHARLSVPVVAAALVAWTAIVLGEHLGPPHLVQHYGTGLVLAVLLAWAVHEILARTQRRLRKVRDDLDAVAAVARCGRSGEDPRPVVLAALRRLAGASSLAWVEPDGSDLVVVLSEGVEAVGLRVPLVAATATTTCWMSRTPVFVSDVTSDGQVDPGYITLTGAVSVLCEPVLHDGEISAVLVVGWGQQIPTLEDHEVSVVSTLAAEAGAAVAASRLRARLEALATTDPMTGVLNRRGWQQQVGTMATMCARSGQPLTLALADLDHFKAFNDAHGHEAGDVLLKDFSRITSTLLRDVDVVARWGGEEFAIALPGSDETAAKVALDRLRQAVPDDQTCSFGIARWDGSESITACLARADAALYRAKAAGRDRVAL